LSSLTIAIIVGGLIAASGFSGLLDSLEPKTPAQTQLLAAARSNYAFIGEQRILMSMQASTPAPWPLVYAVAGWSCLMFGGMGLLSKLNPMAVTMLVLGAASMGVAKSKRRRGGIAVRFPRMLRWRRDKPVAEADTLDVLRALLCRRAERAD